MRSGITVISADAVNPLPWARIVVDPTASAVVSPVLLTIAMAGCIELQVAVAVMSCVVPSLKVAIAWSWLLLPKVIDSVAGTMFRETTAAGFTVRLAVPVRFTEVAPIVAVPIALATAMPVWFTTAIFDADELHTTDCVRF